MFEATHRLALRLFGEGKITGLRIEHIDVLFDPTGYLKMLRAALDGIGPHRPAPADPRRSFDLVVEKILSDGEDLLEDWPVAGTTGYEFLNDLNRLFVDPRRSKAMQRIHERFTGLRSPIEDVAYQSKKVITSTSLASELNVLAHLLNRISEGDRRARDFTLELLREAIREVVACFPVYRTYLDGWAASPADLRRLDRGISRARRRNPAMDPSVFDFLRQALLPTGDASTAGERKRCRTFTGKFQQFTGPVQAKGIEPGNSIRCTVTDNGSGIPEERLGKVFEKLETDGEKGGMGLGPAIVKQYVEAHGGQVTADSVLGAGSTFTFTIPDVA